MRSNPSENQLVLYSPVLEPPDLRKLVVKGKLVFTPDGLMKQCLKCKELWPADTEFFAPYPDRAAKLSSWCRACRHEERANRYRKTNT